MEKMKVSEQWWETVTMHERWRERCARTIGWRTKRTLNEEKQEEGVRFAMTNATATRGNEEEPEKLEEPGQDKRKTTMKSQ